MKMPLVACLCLLFIARCAAATNYTVKQAGGGSFTSIQACANAMATGDTCTVYAGTYNENVTLTAGGVGAYKTLQANTGDMVNVLGFTVGSHDKVIGFHIQNLSSPSTSRCVTIGDTATDVWIQNNSMTGCLTVRSLTSIGTPSYVYFLNNTLTYLCSSPKASPIDVCEGLIPTGDHWLIQGNEFSHLSDGTNVVSYTILRDNYFHDFLESECRYGSNGGNCHFDFAQTEPTVATKYILAEGNHGGNNQGGYDAVANVHGNGHAFLMQGNLCPAPSAGDPYPCAYYIARFNSFIHVAAGAILDNYGANNMGFSHVKVYNNTWVDFNYYAPASGITDLFTDHSFNGADLNNLFYYPAGLNSFNPYADDATTDATFVYRNNLAWCSGADAGVTCNLHSHIYGRGNFINDPGNIKANPDFTNYTANNFTLTASSPPVGAGSYLTTVAAKDLGSGTTLLVNDAGFFQDGFGLMGVKPDQIRVGTTTVVQITSVNYSTNTLSLAKPINRSPGDPIYLFSDSTGSVVLFGNAPGIGAFPTGLQQVPAPPSGLTVSVS